MGGLYRLSRLIDEKEMKTFYGTFIFLFFNLSVYFLLAGQMSYLKLFLLREMQLKVLHRKKKLQIKIDINKHKIE